MAQKEMGYHLEIRPRADGPARQVEELRAALLAAGCTGSSEWSYGARVGAGELKVTLRVPVDGAALISLEVPYGAPAEEAGLALLLALRLGEALAFRADDPQLGQEVALGDREAVERRFADASAWAVRYAGTSEDPRSVGSESAIPKEARSGQVTLLVALAALLVGALLLVELAGRWMTPPEQPPAYADPAAAGP